MDTKALRQRILDLAIRGKLVPQDSKDEPASVLLERIRAEKERLIAEGKIKRPKKSKSTSSKSHYQNFELPVGWAMVYLKDIAQVGTGATPLKADKSYYNGDIAWVNSSATSQDYIYAPSGYITEKAISETNCVVYPSGTLIMAMYGEGKTRGQVAELAIPAATNQACAAIQPYIPEIKDYIKRYLEGNYMHLRTLAEGGMQPNLNLGVISDYFIPLPPMQEQHRIIFAINQWFTLIDEMESGKLILSGSIQQAKSKILDLAIHGKLVPQNSEDMPAEELLKRVNPKARIITDNPQYGNIPQGWCLATVKDVFMPMKRKLPSGEKFFYIDIDSVDNATNTVFPKLIETSNAPSRASRATDKGDIVFSMVRPYLRNIAIVPTNECVASTGFYVFSPTPVINESYSFYLFLSSYFVDGINHFMKGDNSPSVTKDNVENYVIPIPPFAEQKRIVTKIEELFAVLDGIQKSLEA